MNPLEIIDTVSAPVTSALNMGVSAIQNKKARKWATKEAEKAYARQIEQITQQNIYNSPLKQMERFKAAGLNPNLMYGQVSNANQQGIAEYSKAAGEYDLPGVVAPNIGGALQPYSNMETQNQQRRNMVAEEKLVNSKVLESIANLPGISAATELSISETDFKKAEMAAQRPYLYRSAAQKYESAAASLRGQNLSNQEKAEFLSGGGIVKQLAGMEASNRLKTQELLNTQLDYQIQESRKQLLDQEYATRERFGGIMPSGLGGTGVAAAGSAIEKLSGKISRWNYNRNVSKKNKEDYQKMASRLGTVQDLERNWWGKIK